jgi:acyl CoA:acetate/3-ketoacid CoA transferase beta subunit/acyl CoA:acetate/3-ketoacid CoA transferase alpha subunit
MDAEVEALLERRFRAPSPAEDIVRSLPEAISSVVRSGDAVHLGVTHTRWSAGFWELLRRFRGTDPGFELLAVQFTTPSAPLIHAGLARRLVTSWLGDSYMSPASNPVFQRFADGGGEIEHWSLLTFVQRLQAAARGHAWTTTTSLAGSSMAADNAHAYRELEPGLGLVSALVPDVSILHAPAADPFGNVLLPPPLMENAYGALAARRGAVVTVERIVEPDYVREHAHLTRLPAGVVRAVVEAPLGGHPGGLVPTGLRDIEGYADDFAFWLDLRAAARDPRAMDAWIAEWVVEPGSHAAYVERLGAERVDGLRRRVDPTTWRDDLEGSPPEDLHTDAYSAVELAMVVAGRTLAERIREEGHRVILAGAGMANLAAWLAAFTLRDQGVPVDLAAEMGLIGYWPVPGEPLLFNPRNFPGCTMLADIDFTLGILVGGGAARAIGALGAAQIDARGNVNSTLIPGERLLMGSGGANDVATCAAETLVVAAQTRERFVERVPYVTAPGARIRRLVSQLGVYERDGDELVLAAVPGDDTEAAVREAREACGWELRVAREVRRIEPPTREELQTLRLMDPNGWFRR